MRGIALLAALLVMVAGLWSLSAGTSSARPAPPHPIPTTYTRFNCATWDQDFMQNKKSCTTWNETGCKELPGAQQYDCFVAYWTYTLHVSCYGLFNTGKKWCEDANTKTEKTTVITNSISDCKKSGSSGCKVPDSATTPTSGSGSGSGGGGSGSGGSGGGLLDSVSSGLFGSISNSFAAGATWLLTQLTSTFFASSTITLAADGITTPYSLMWGLSMLIAMVLLSVQLARTALLREGAGLATALAGLAKWGLICVSLITLTQAALAASDQVCTWMVTQSSYGSTQAFNARLAEVFGTFFSDPVTGAGLLLVLAVLAIVVLLVLLAEMQFRHAAIDVLISAAPIAAAGEMALTSREWWPKTRSALISMVILKPVIVLIFLIGMSQFGTSTTFSGFWAGMVTLILACIAWPAIAKFLTFTSVGAGGSLMSGLIGAAGGTAASALWGRGGGSPSGSGGLPPGAKFAQQLQSESDQRSGGGGSNVSKGVLGAIMGLQGLKSAKELGEGGMEAMAAHAELGPGKDLGGQMSLPPSSGGGSEEKTAAAASANSQAEQEGGPAALPPGGEGPRELQGGQGPRELPRGPGSITPHPGGAGSPGRRNGGGRGAWAQPNAPQLSGVGSAVAWSGRTNAPYWVTLERVDAPNAGGAGAPSGTGSGARVHSGAPRAELPPAPPPPPGLVPVLPQLPPIPPPPPMHSGGEGL